MTNFEWIKRDWIRKIRSLKEDELYETLTNGTANIGVCKYCEQVFPPCRDTLENDNICRERFKIMCNMEHQKKEEDVRV